MLDPDRARIGIVGLGEFVRDRAFERAGGRDADRAGDRMGGVQRTVLIVTVARVLPEQNLILIRGAVLGATRNLSRSLAVSLGRAFVPVDDVNDGSRRATQRRTGWNHS